MWSTPQTFTYDGTTHHVKANLIGVYASDSNDVTATYTGSSVSSAADVGNYSVEIDSLGGSAASNYTLGSTTYSVNWNITQRQLVLAWTSNNLDASSKAIYSSANNIGKILTISNIITGDTIKLTGVLTGEFVNANVLNTPVVGDASGEGSYDFSEEMLVLEQ